MVRPSELTSPGIGVLEVVGELRDVLGSKGRVRDVVDRPDGLLRVPGHLHLASRIPGSQQASSLGVASFVETFVGLGQQAAGPIQRVVLAASMTERLGLDPTATLIQLGVRQPDDVKWVGHLGGVGHHGVEHLAVRSGQVQRGPLDAVPPLGRSLCEPVDRSPGAASLDDVEELPSSDVDDLGGPLLASPWPETTPQRLIETRRGDAKRRVVPERERGAIPPLPGRPPPEPAPGPADVGG